MATEHQLRQRLAELEAQLKRQQQESRRLQEQLRRETQAQIQQTRQRLQREYQRQLNETAEAYARRIREAQEAMARQSRLEIERLQREAQAQMDQTRQTMQAMEQVSQELQGELQKLKDEKNRQNTEFRSAAQEAQAQAELAKTQAEQTPHDFFCPQEFAIIDTHLKDIRDLIEQEMYQAAVSDAACIELEFQILKAKVEQAFSEWLQAFEDYRSILQLLHGRIQVFSQQKFHTSAGDFRIAPPELNFWSSGAYETLVSQIETAYNTFCTMDDGAVVEYLRTQAGKDRKAIYTMLTQGKKWEDQLTAVLNCITSERILSDQRYVVAEEAARRLEELNYQEEICAFREAQGGVETQSWYIADPEENPMTSFELVMTLARWNQLKLRLIPRREHGLAVGNLCYLSFSLVSACDPVTELQMSCDARAILEPMLQVLAPGVQCQFLPSTEKPEEYLSKRERMLNTPPNPQAQMRHLERKYQ